MIGTDESWAVTTGVIRFSEIYDGETQDTTLPESAPEPAIRYGRDFDTIIGQENEPVRCLVRLAAEKLKHMFYRHPSLLLL